MNNLLTDDEIMALMAASRELEEERESMGDNDPMAELEKENALLWSQVEELTRRVQELREENRELRQRWSNATTAKK